MVPFTKAHGLAKVRAAEDCKPIHAVCGYMHRGARPKPEGWVSRQSYGVAAGNQDLLKRDASIWRMQLCRGHPHSRKRLSGGGTSRDNRVDDRGKLGRGVDAVGSARLLQHWDYRLPSLHLASL